MDLKQKLFLLLWLPFVLITIIWVIYNVNNGIANPIYKVGCKQLGYINTTNKSQAIEFYKMCEELQPPTFNSLLEKELERQFLDTLNLSNNQTNWQITSNQTIPLPKTLLSD